MKKTFALIWFLLLGFAFPAYPDDGPRVIEAPPRVMVFPFSPIGDPGSYQWIGTGIQQSLLVEVNRPGVAFSMPVTAPTTQPSSNNPIDDSAKAGATMAVFGSFQIVNNSVRCTGEVVDTGNGRVLASLTATGTLAELFKVEDTLDAQLRSVLPLPQGWSATEQDVVSPVVVDHSQLSPPAYSQSYPVTYGLPYPYYSGYDAPFIPFSTGFVFINGGGRGNFRGSRHFGGPGIGFTGSVGGLGGSFHGGFGVGFHSTGAGGGRR